MKALSLFNGGYAFVDDEDFDGACGYNWRGLTVGRRVYATRKAKILGKWVTVYLHRSLLPGVEQVDHKDGNGLNCQRYNLRPATHSQNQQGFQQKRIGKTSEFRGVSWSASRSLWVAQIKLSGRTKFLGRFEEEHNAAKAYDAATRELFETFADLNFK